MNHIFVSHAKPDRDAASTLAEHLRNAGHETKVDTQDLGLGQDAIEFMNDAITDAAFVVILFSRDTPDALWQKTEINAALWNELQQDGGRCIVVRLDDTPLPPLLGTRVYARLDPTDPASLQTVVEQICAATVDGSPASSIVSRAFRSDSTNPFRHLRAEFFEVEPELHARTFAPPEQIKVGALQDMKPCLLEGSRGTGKSMLLLSLRTRNLLLRQRSGKIGSLTHFGFYLKLTRGAICNAGPSLEESEESHPPMLLDVAEQEIVLQIVESLVSELDYCLSNDLLDHDRFDERAFSEEAAALLFGDCGRPARFDDLKERMASLHRSLADFIRRRFIYGEEASVPVATLGLDQVKRLVELVRKHRPDLRGSMFVILLDEYENLLPYQKKIVNSFLKLGPPQVSVKIAKRLASGEVPGTTMGQELQEIHDYTRVPLVYDVADPQERKAYRQLLRDMVERVTELELGSTVAMERLLPPFVDREVEDEPWIEELAALLKITPGELAALDEAERRRKEAYYGEAAEYRVLLKRRGRRAEKRFAGFSDLSYLGSGVIRYFQEFLSVAYHLSEAGKDSRTGELVLAPEVQSRAVHIVSQHNLTTLSRNVERYGEELKYFLLDLGDCLRHKLMKHSSEPEAARITIEDPELLQERAMRKVRTLLSVGEKEGVFQTKEGLPAFKPKHGSDPQPAEFNICRVYAPVLQISPRHRWRTNVRCGDLQGLLESGKRGEAMRALKRKIVRRKRDADSQDALVFPETQVT